MAKKTDNPSVKANASALLTHVENFWGGEGRFFRRVAIKAMKMARESGNEVSPEACRKELRNARDRYTKAINKSAKVKQRFSTLCEFAAVLKIEVEGLVQDGPWEIPTGKKEQNLVTELTHGFFADKQPAQKELCWSHEKVCWAEQGEWGSAFKGFENGVVDCDAYRGTLTNFREEIYDFSAERIHPRVFALTAKQRLAGNKGAGGAFQATMTRYDRDNKLLMGTWHGVSASMLHGTFGFVLSAKDLRKEPGIMEAVHEFYDKRQWKPEAPADFGECRTPKRTSK